MADAGAAAGAAASTAWHDILACLTASMGVVMSMAFAVVRRRSTLHVQSHGGHASDSNCSRLKESSPEHQLQDEFRSWFGRAWPRPWAAGSVKETHGDRGDDQEALSYSMSCLCAMLDTLVRDCKCKRVRNGRRQTAAS